MERFQEVCGSEDICVGVVLRRYEWVWWLCVVVMRYVWVLRLCVAVRKYELV